MFQYIGYLISIIHKLFTKHKDKNGVTKLESFYRGKEEIASIESNLIQTSRRIKVIIDPPSGYFFFKIFLDVIDYEILLLIHVCEPNKLNNIRKFIIDYAKYFTKIYSYDPIVLSKIENGKLFCFGNSWILTNKKQQVTMSDNKGYIDIKKQEYRNIFTLDKKFKLSFIKSNKKLLPGHKIRHQVANVITKKRDYELFFPSTRIDSKIPLFIDSMFHIAIENSQETNYFTEKIVDCFISHTVPIYWGCPNIGDYFDTNGIIFFSNEKELATILDSLTPEDYWQRLDVMKKNKQIAEDKYVFFSERLNDIIKAI